MSAIFFLLNPLPHQQEWLCTEYLHGNRFNKKDRAAMLNNRQKPTQLMPRSDDWCNYFIEQQHTKVVTDWSRTACDPLAWILHLTSISSKITKLQYSWYTIDSKLLQYVICINNLTNQNWTMTSNVLNLKFNEIVMYRMVRVTDLYLYWVEASVKSGSQTRPYVGWLTLQNTSQTTMPQFSQTLIRIDIFYAVYPKTFSHDFFLK